MAEEHGFQASKNHRLCANNCGFIGKPATGNFCSKCYRDLCLKDEGKPKLRSENSFFASNISSSADVANPPSATDPGTVSVGTIPPAAEAVAEAFQGINPNRCSACRKKVGLMGFRCRCGITFCGTHRYPEKHGCTFDFKAMGREAIAKANPLIKATKLEKI